MTTSLEGWNPSEFNQLLLKVIDEQLKGIFGESGAQLIYSHLANHHSLKKEEIPENIEVFARVLEDFLGSGAHAIESLLLRKIYSKFGRALKENCGFGESIARLRNFWIREHLKRLDW